MDWYYVESNQQIGPINETDFDGLVRAGRISQDTLVWREGMEEWRAYGQVRSPAVAVSTGSSRAIAVAAAPNGIVCSQCGNSFSPDEVIRYGQSWVCASCKPVFVQKLREGVSLPTGFVYAGFWIRVAATFIDGIILTVVNALAGAVLGALIGPGPVEPGDMSGFFAFQALLFVV
jgi:hypothetical protein